MLNGVSAVSPFNGEDDVDLGVNIIISFDFDADPTTVNTSTIQLRNPAGDPVSSVISYDLPTRTAIINPNEPLLLTPNYYTATVTTSVLEVGTGAPVDQAYSWSFTTQSPVFQDTVVLDGLAQPTVVRFAPDGRVFVAEKSGIIKVFDGLDDSNGPDVFADLRPQVHNYWDRGLLGMALHPDFPSSPYVYVHYTYNAPWTVALLPPGRPSTARTTMGRAPTGLDRQSVRTCLD